MNAVLVPVPGELVTPIGSFGPFDLWSITLMGLCLLAVATTIWLMIFIREDM